MERAPAQARTVLMMSSVSLCLDYAQTYPAAAGLEKIKTVFDMVKQAYSGRSSTHRELRGGMGC